MNVEYEILSNIVNRSDMRSAIRLGITADFFRTSMGQEVWNWVYSEYQRPETQGEVPDPVRLRRRFPNFEFSPTENSIKALMIEANDAYLEKDTHAVIDALQTMLEEGYDARNIIIEGVEKLKDLQSSQVMSDGNFLKNMGQELKARYERRKKNDGVIGIPYPYGCLNAMTGGMCPGDLVYIYGRPGQMKSWLLSVIAAKTAEIGKRVLVYTKEIDDFTMSERIVSILLGLDYSRFREGKLEPTQESDFLNYMDIIEKSSEDWETNLFFVTDKGRKTPRTVSQLMTVAERLSPDVVVIDGFYLLNPGKMNSNKSDHEKIKAISRELKQQAQSLGVPILCTSQANREGKKNSEMGATEDAAFSDAVGQDADMMLRCFKGPHPSVHNGNSLLVVPKKVREGGAEGNPKPFIINANPSYDWSLQQYPADAKAFFKDQEAAEAAIGGRPPGSKSSPYKKRRSNGPFKA